MRAAAGRSRTTYGMPDRHETYKRPIRPVPLLFPSHDEAVMRTKKAMNAGASRKRLMRCYTAIAAISSPASCVYSQDLANFSERTW